MRQINTTLLATSARVSPPLHRGFVLYSANAVSFPHSAASTAGSSSRYGHFGVLAPSLYFVRHAPDANAYALRLPEYTWSTCVVLAHAMFE